METHADAGATDSRPTPDEAAAALREVEQTRAALTEIRTPLWYFVVLGLWTAPLGPLLSLTQGSPLRALFLPLILAAWAAGLAALVHVVVRRMRVSMWLTNRQMLPLAVIMTPLLIAYILVQGLAGPPWGPESVTLFAGLGIIVFGIHHRLAGGRSS